MKRMTKFKDGKYICINDEATVGDVLNTLGRYEDLELSVEEVIELKKLKEKLND